MKLKFLSIPAVALMLVALSASAQPANDPAKQSVTASDIGRRVIIIGDLNKPLGTYLTIEGVRPERGGMRNNPLEVDTIDGKKLDKPVIVDVRGTQQLPKEGRIVLRGYETGAMAGIPLDPLVKYDNDNLPQAIYHFALMFTATEIKQPATLERDHSSR